MLSFYLAFLYADRPYYNHFLDRIADFDVLSNDPETTAQIVKERLKDIDVKNTKIIKRQSVGEVIPEHYEVKIGSDTVVIIYKPIACNSYNILNIKGQTVKIATIDTMLSFYLAFLYADRPYYNQFLERILCMSKFLFDVKQKNRLEQKGLLRRFSITCYGHQESVEEIRSHKAAKYKEIKQTGDKKEMEEWFLNYKPDDIKNKKIETFTKSKKMYKKKKRKVNTKKNKGLFAIYGGKTRRKY